MDDVTRFEERFEERIRAFATTGVQSVDSGAVARAAAVGYPKTAAIKPDQRRRLDEIRRPRSISRTTFAAAAVLAIVALGGALFVVAGGPSPTPSADPSPSLPVVVAPSASPSRSEPAQPTPSFVAGPEGAWIATGTMGTPRSGRTTAVRLLDGRVLVAGGSDDDNDTSAELYDPDTGTWSATGNMAKPYAGFPATLLHDGKVLVGDVDDAAPTAPNDSITGAEVYDPESGTWAAATEKMVKGAGSGTATLLRDGNVLVAGLDGAQLYEPAGGTWTATGTMITPRYNHTATLLPDGRVLVAGGDVPPDQAVDSAELYDPDTGSWTATANLRATGTTRSDNITATLLQDGTVLVVRPSTAELYDPATGTWTATGEQPRPGTAYRSAILLSDGKVLVPFSEVDAVTPGSTATELYDPGTRSWTTAAPMLRNHRNPAILLLDGTVLVAGGDECTDGECVTTGSAELYVPAGVSPPSVVVSLVPTPVPTPTPSPTPPPVPPALGPVPPGARPWTVTVDNKSSEPATLFQAEEGETGVGRLCGNVTPNVVPAGAKVQVSFLLPPKNVTSCWIWVNPVPGEGGSFFQTSDAPLKGGFLIDEGGQEMWGGAP